MFTRRAARNPVRARNHRIRLPKTTEYAPAYGAYVALVPEDDILLAMRSEMAQTLALLRGVGERDACVCHPPFTWTIKQVIGHLTDCERIFGYRALRFARRLDPPTRLRRE